MRYTPEQVKQRARIDYLLFNGTVKEWARAIVDYANLPEVREVGLAEPEHHSIKES